MSASNNRLLSYFSLVSILSMLSSAWVSAAEGPQPREVSPKELLGADFAQAKIVGVDENLDADKCGLVAARLSGGKPVTIASWPRKDFRSGRTRWSIDGRQIIFTVNGECWVYGDPQKAGASLDDFATNGRRVLQDEYVTEACFWDACWSSPAASGCGCNWWRPSAPGRGRI